MGPCQRLHGLTSLFPALYVSGRKHCGDETGGQCSPTPSRQNPLSIPIFRCSAGGEVQQAAHSPPPLSVAPPTRTCYGDLAGLQLLRLPKLHHPRQLANLHTLQR